jgi:hypothetical protein
MRDSHPRRNRALSVAAAALTLAGCGGSAPDPGPGSRAPRPADVFLSPTGSDSAGCKRSSPCRTLERGYRAAKAGQVVELAAGDYPSATLRRDRHKRPGSARVTLQAARGARARIGHLVLAGGVRGLVFRHLDFPDGWDAGPDDGGPPAQDISFRGTTGATFSIMNARGLTVAGGAYGPRVDDAPQIKVYNPDDTYLPTRILIAGVRFHDFTRSSEDVHTECLQVYAGLRVTIRGNRFSNCDGTGALDLTTLGASRLRDAVVENNWFDATGDAYYAVQVDLSVERLVFRYNSSPKSMAIMPCSGSPCGSATVSSNVMEWNPSFCAAGVVYVDNVLRGGRCDRSDQRVRRLGFVDEAAFDLHLAPSSPARCAGDPAVIPATDVDGQRRGRGRRPDAGADQAPVTRPLSARCRLGGGP